jgi:hypothetical protein
MNSCYNEKCFKQNLQREQQKMFENLLLRTTAESGKGTGKVHPRTGHEGPDGE